MATSDNLNAPLLDDLDNSQVSQQDGLNTSAPDAHGAQQPVSPQSNDVRAAETQQNRTAANAAQPGAPKAAGQRAGNKPKAAAQAAASPAAPAAQPGAAPSDARATRSEQRRTRRSHRHRPLLDLELPRDHTSALDRGFRDVSDMPSRVLGVPPEAQRLYSGYLEGDQIEHALYEQYDVKRGLRNSDGTGVVAGLTTISCVHGYARDEEGNPVPDDGDLRLRGYHIADLVDGAWEADRFGYEEVSYLLLTGSLPTADELSDYNARIDERRELPYGYLNIFPRTTASPSIMNVLARASLMLYAFDDTPDDISPTHEIDVALTLIARLPRIAALAHEASVAAADERVLKIPPVFDGASMAETLLDILRGDAGFTHDEAMLLDTMLMLHAEHGGGNNSTFTCRVLSSSGTDAYSAYAGAMGSLKGPKHGGANYKANEMIDDVAAHVRHIDDDDEVADYLTRILKKQAFDRTGLIYGLGHAVYTKTDPRAELVRKYASRLARAKGGEEAAKLDLIARIERLGPQLMRDVRGITKPISTNIDMYTGFVYTMLGIPQDLFTPIFAIARMSGWAAHRMEELYGEARIIRPAYTSVLDDRAYQPLEQR